MDRKVINELKLIAAMEYGVTSRQWALVMDNLPELLELAEEAIRREDQDGSA